MRGKNTVRLLILSFLLENVKASSLSKRTTFYPKQKSKVLLGIPRGGDINSGKSSLGSLDLALAGSLATMIGDAVMHPLDCIKTLQQSDSGLGLNMIQAGKLIFKSDGILGFYSGLGTYVLSDGGAGAFKFAAYEALKLYTARNIPEQYIGLALFGCAALAFIASSIVIVPGELLKQRLQMGQISSVTEGITSILENEGFLGLFRGYSGVCFRDIPYTMFELGIYDNLKNAYIQYKNRNGDQVTLTQIDEIIAAAITGGITGFLTAPLDTIKTKIMVDADTYDGFVDAVRKTVEQHGITGMFQGAAARVAWIMPFTAIYLPLYDIFKRKLELFRHINPE